MRLALIKWQGIHSFFVLKTLFAGMLSLFFMTGCGQQLEPLAISLKTSEPVYFGKFDQSKNLGAAEQQNFDVSDTIEFSLASASSGGYSTTTETRVTLKNIDAEIGNSINKSTGYFGGQVVVFMDGSVTNWISNIKVSNNVRIVGKTYSKTK